MRSTRNFIFALSGDASVEAILTDIPFISVGLLAFGISTFFLVMKRVNLLAIYLYSSALVAFGAAILDLTQILSRGNGLNDTVIDDNTINGLINAREVGFSLSTGFLLLFYWRFVAERPGAEPRKNDPKGREHLHSASWQHWGYLGHLLKWSLLGLVISVSVLQIVWRTSARRFGTVYMVESTIQIVVTALFIMKIFLNIFLSPALSRAIRSYIAPLAALLINLGIAIANLLSFLFSENTLGRLLQAVELYILILFILIGTFYDVSPRHRKNKPSLSFIGLDNKADALALQLPVQEDAPSGALFGNAVSSDQQMIPSSPQPITYKLSSWMQQSRISLRSSFNRQSIVTRDPETGSPPATSRGLRIQSEAVSFSPKASESQLITGQQLPSLISAMDQQNPDIPGYNEPNIQGTDSLSLGSYYDTNKASRISFPSVPFASAEPRKGADSPVYGLNGIMMTSNRSSVNNDNVQRTSSTWSFEELLRQQTELDKSIAALRLFSPDTGPTVLSTTLPSSTPSPKPIPSERVPSTSTSGQRIESASARSDFSLSIFPEPPSVGGSAIPTRGSVRMSTMVPSSRFVSIAPSEQLPGIPSSPNQPELGRLDSSATQYVITSFIGNGLTDTRSILESEKSFESADTTGSQTPTQPTLANIAASAGSITIPNVPIRPPPASPLYPDSPIDLSTHEFSGPTGRNMTGPTVTYGPRVPVQYRNRSVSSSSRPGIRLNISGPKSDVKVELEPDAFERPRRPPIIAGP